MKALVFLAAFYVGVPLLIFLWCFFGAIYDCWRYRRM
jgi:hypothetical protein